MWKETGPVSSDTLKERKVGNVWNISGWRDSIQEEIAAFMNQSTSVQYHDIKEEELLP